MSLSSERQLVAHLLRRAGFGASPQEIDAYTRMGFEGTVARLVDYEQVPNHSLEAEVAAMERELDLTKLGSIQTIWLHRMLRTQRPLQEKMTLFWHDHFATANSKVGKPVAMYQQNQFFRANALGYFSDLLAGISRDPAMLKWLDSNSNRKGKPNENYARELMELFTLGVGNYTERDVREGARAFTGWFLDKNFQFTFNARQHDGGRKTFLGETGNWDGDDVLRIILEQPAAARYIARKLFTFFAHDHPSKEAVQRFAALFRNTNYSVRSLVRAIFLSPEFSSPDAYHAIVKSPVDYLVGSIKVLGIGELLPNAPGFVGRMGMNLLNPPTVAGWDWGTGWIGTNTLLERANIASALATQRGQNERRGVDLATLIESLGATTPETLVDGLLDLLVDADVEPAVRDALVEYAMTGYSGAPESWLRDRQHVDRTGRGVAHLIMATPVYHMA